MESRLPLVPVLQGRPGEEVGSTISSFTEFNFLVFVLVSFVCFQARHRILGQPSGFIVFLFIG